MLTTPIGEGPPTAVGAAGGSIGSGSVGGPGRGGRWNGRAPERRTGAGGCRVSVSGTDSTASCVAPQRTSVAGAPRRWGRDRTAGRRSRCRCGSRDRPPRPFRPGRPRGRHGRPTRSRRRSRSWARPPTSGDARPTRCRPGASSHRRPASSPPTERTTAAGSRVEVAAAGPACAWSPLVGRSVAPDTMPARSSRWRAGTTWPSTASPARLAARVERVEQVGDGGVGMVDDDLEVAARAVEVELDVHGRAPRTERCWGPVAEPGCVAGATRWSAAATPCTHEPASRHLALGTAVDRFRTGAGRR